MLTGYIFAGSDVAVERLLLIRERPAPIPEAPIEHLRRKEVKLNGDRISHWAKGPPITVNVGSFLRILESFAFAGLFGTVTAIDDEAREIDAVGRMVPLRLQPEQVEAV